MSSKCQTEFPCYLEASHPRTIWTTSFNDNVKLRIFTKHQSYNHIGPESQERPFLDRKECWHWMICLVFRGELSILHCCITLPRNQKHVLGALCLTNKCSSLCRKKWETCFLLLSPLSQLVQYSPEIDVPLLLDFK